MLDPNSLALQQAAGMSLEPQPMLTPWGLQLLAAAVKSNKAQPGQGGTDRPFSVLFFRAVMAKRFQFCF